MTTKTTTIFKTSYYNELQGTSGSTESEHFNLTYLVVFMNLNLLWISYTYWLY